MKRPLTDLTKKNTVWQWGEAEEGAFREIKMMLTSALSRGIRIGRDHLSFTQIGPKMGLEHALV